jgi:GNAT superfamily N-acetyltransferase
VNADVSCRVAWGDDAPAIAAVQVRAWRASYDGILPGDLLDSMSADELAEHWRASLIRPPDARNRVLVALERNLVTGFALTGPASDPDCDPVADGEVTDLTVDPHKRGQGHGSRLVQAAVDTLRADRFTRAVAWLAAQDDASRSFLTGAGWAPDGAHRTLDLTGDGSVQVKQVRLHTSLG